MIGLSVLVWIAGFVTGYAACTLYFDNLIERTNKQLKEQIRKAYLAALKPEYQDDQR